MSRPGLVGKIWTGRIYGAILDILGIPGPRLLNCVRTPHCGVRVPLPEADLGIKGLRFLLFFADRYMPGPRGFRETRIILWGSAS